MHVVPESIQLSRDQRAAVREAIADGFEQRRLELRRLRASRVADDVLDAIAFDAALEGIMTDQRALDAIVRACEEARRR